MLQGLTAGPAGEHLGDFRPRRRGIDVADEDELHR
jgi:hypothetical protein